MTKPKTILALDLGTKCGWAIGDGLTGDNVVATRSGVWNLTPKKGDEPGRRWDLFDTFLDNLICSTPLNAIAYEVVSRHAGTMAAHVYGGFKALVEREAYTYFYDLIPLHVGTIKKHATGKGNASKAMMIAAANERWGIEVGDDNQADALWILDLALTRGG